MSNEEMYEQIKETVCVVAEEVILDLSDRLDNKNKVIEDKLDKLIEILAKLL